MALSIWHRQQSIEILSAIALDENLKPNDRISAVDKLNAMHGYNAPQKLEHLSNNASTPKITLDLKKLPEHILKAFIDARQFLERPE